MTNPNEENHDVETFIIDSNYNNLGELLNLGSRWEILGSFQWEGKSASSFGGRLNKLLLSHSRSNPYATDVHSLFYHSDNLLPKNFPNEIREGWMLEESLRRLLVCEILPERTAKEDFFATYTDIDLPIADRAVIISKGVYTGGDKTGADKRERPSVAESAAEDFGGKGCLSLLEGIRKIRIRASCCFGLCGLLGCFCSLFGFSNNW